MLFIISQFKQKDFVIQLVGQKLVIKKNKSQGNESYHKISINEDLPQPPRHSLRTSAKENFNKASEVKSGEVESFLR